MAFVLGKRPDLSWLVVSRRLHSADLSALTLLTTSDKVAMRCKTGLARWLSFGLFNGTVRILQLDRHRHRISPPRSPQDGG